MNVQSVVPEEIVSYFIKIGVAPDDVSEPDTGIFRVNSAYGPGDFSMTDNHMIKNSYAGFIGDDKVEYTKIIDPNRDFEIIAEWME